jgi:hypothetical protein
MILNHPSKRSVSNEIAAVRIKLTDIENEISDLESRLNA